MQGEANQEEASIVIESLLNIASQANKQPE
jgi:hypothetical protein